MLEVFLENSIWMITRYSCTKGDMSVVGPRPWPKQQYTQHLQKGYIAKEN